MIKKMLRLALRIAMNINLKSHEYFYHWGKSFYLWKIIKSYLATSRAISFAISAATTFLF